MLPDLGGLKIGFIESKIGFLYSFNSLNTASKN